MCCDLLCCRSNYSRAMAYINSIDGMVLYSERSLGGRGIPDQEAITRVRECYQRAIPLLRSAYLNKPQASFQLAKLYAKSMQMSGTGIRAYDIRKII